MALDELKSLMRPVHQNDSPISAPTQTKNISETPKTKSVPTVSQVRRPWIVAICLIIFAAMCCGVALGALCALSITRFRKAAVRNDMVLGGLTEAREILLDPPPNQEMGGTVDGPPQ